MCGDGDAQDIGYAPIARGAGSYLPDMSNHAVQAREVETQFVSSLYGSGSTRPVHVQEVTLGEGHARVVKGFYARHMEMQKTFCRLHQGHGQSYGMAAPSNFDAQVCSCSEPNVRDVAKALVPSLSNRERTMLDFDDVIEFVEDVVRAGFTRIEKAVFPVGKHGKVVTQHVGDRSGNIDVHFHPSGGGDPVHLGTATDHHSARKIAIKHSNAIMGSGGSPTPQQKEAAAVEISPGWHALAGGHTPAGEHAGRSSVGSAPTGGPKTTVGSPKARSQSGSEVKPKITFSGARTPSGETGAHPISVKKGASEIEMPTDYSPRQSRQERGTHGYTKPQAQAPQKEIEMPEDDSPRRNLAARDAARATKFADALTGPGPSASRRPSGGNVPPKPGVQPAGSPLSYMGMPTKPRVPQDPYADAKPPKGTPQVGKQSKPAATPQVPSMSTMPKKTEASSPRVSYKALDSITRLTKALDEIEKGPDRPRVVGKQAFDLQEAGYRTVRAPGGNKTLVGTGPTAPPIPKGYAASQGGQSPPGGWPKEKTAAPAQKVQSGPKVKVESARSVPKAAPRQEIAGGYKPMSQTNPKTEATQPRVSYKALDSVARLTKAIDEISKGGGDAPKAHPAQGTVTHADGTRMQYMHEKQATPGPVSRAKFAAKNPGPIRLDSDRAAAPSSGTFSPTVMVPAPRPSVGAVIGSGQGQREKPWYNKNKTDIFGKAEGDAAVPHVSHFKSPHGSYKVESNHSTGEHVVHYTPKTQAKQLSRRDDHISSAPAQSVRMKSHEHAVKMAQIHAFVNNHDGEHTHATLHENHVTLHPRPDGPGVTGHDEPEHVSSMKQARDTLGY